jgi:CubicO group peptidase (beta-lactamase class C family)
MSGLPGDLGIGARLSGGVQKQGNGASGPRLVDGRNRSLPNSVQGLAKEGLKSEPGAEFHYATMGFNVAARVAEVAAGRPFEELVKAELLEPLGMSRTRYVPMGPGALSPKPTLPSGESRFILAGGGVTSTLDDFAAFYQMQLNGGTYRGRRILSEQAVRTMHTRQARLLPMFGPYGMHYGLAFFLDRLDSENRGRAVGHPGIFGTTPWLDKDRDLVGVILVQTGFLRVVPLVSEIQSKVRTMVRAQGE